MSEYIVEEPNEHGASWRVHEHIVRCRDCKYVTDEGYGCKYFSHYEQGASYRWEDVPAEVKPDGFCAWGRDEGGRLMNDKKQARLVKRGRDIITGAPYEIWDVGDGRGIYVDFYDSDNKTFPYESGSKAFPVDMSRLMVDGEMIGSWPYDAIGGKAIREFGYEPVEDEWDDGEEEW